MKLPKIEIKTRYDRWKEDFARKHNLNSKDPFRFSSRLAPKPTKTGIERAKKKLTTNKEKLLLVQPLDKDGYTSDAFNKLYGKKNNPYLGTERDRKNKKRYF